MATSLVSPPLSPPASLNGSRRRLSLRRGSVSAFDPYNTFATNAPISPDHTQSSKLTILRLEPQFLNPEDVSFQHRLSGKASSGRNHRRAGSSASTSSSREREPREKERVSFAFSSFSPPSSPKASHQGIRSPVLGPARPTSPLSGIAPGRGLGGHHRSPSSGSTASRDHSRRPLSPDQLCDLARQSFHPPPSPGTSSPLGSPAVGPATFTPMADDVVLPFLDRPSEVQSLLTSGPTSRLWQLLSQTFPRDLLDESSNPATWSFTQLENWMTTVDRGGADDEVWVVKARECIRARSEVIWERLKGALGVPPELDEAVFDLEAHDERVIVEEMTTRSPIESAPRMRDILEDEDLHGGEKLEDSLRGLSFSTRPSLLGGVALDLPASSSQDTYDVVAERGPGNPLFPSSFARLTLAPTLAANNPLLRSPLIPPASAYSPSGLRKHRKLASWADGVHMGNLAEYAVTTASGSSIAGDLH